MSYNAGPVFSPLQALEAYQKLFSGPITVGMQIPPEVYGHALTLPEVHRTNLGVRKMNGAGIMVWPTSPDGKEHIDIETVEKAVCEDFQLTPCPATTSK
jgi:hypothetical protein